MINGGNRHNCVRLKVYTANVQGLLGKSLLLLFSPIESPSLIRAHPGCDIAHVYL